MQSRFLQVAIIALLFPSDSLAQQTTVPRGVAVQDRARPDYDPLGIRAGAFSIFPQIGVDAIYDDNIFATRDNTIDDWIIQLRPQIRFQSEWPRHSLAVRTGAILGYYQDNENENYQEYFVLANGRLDIMTGTTVSGSGGYERLHEERGSPNDVNGIEPTEFDRQYLRLDIERAITSLQLRAGPFYDNFDFHSVRAVGGIINQDNRDRDVYGGYVRLGYAASPNLLGFIRGSYNWRRYDIETSRNSEGYQLDAGVSLDIGGITTGEAFLGYREQDFESPAFQTFDGFTYGASILWNPTPLTSVRFGITDEIEETILAGSSSYEAITYSVDVNHELLRNLLIGAAVAYREEDFQQIGRQDDFTRYRVSVNYLLNRNFNVEAGFNHDERSSNRPWGNYTINRIFISITAAL